MSAIAPYNRPCLPCGAKTIQQKEVGAANERGEDKHKNKLFFWTFPFMEYLKSSLPWLFGKRKRGAWETRENELVFEEPPKKKPKVGQGLLQNNQNNGEIYKLFFRKLF